MSFLEPYKELDTAFMDAGHPDLSDFSGEYLVNILMVPGYRSFIHRKIFYRANNKVLGYNVLFNKTWGHFNVEDGSVTVPDPLNVAVINYNRPENCFLIRGIRDHIRCLKRDALYIGRANYLVYGTPRFLGYFTLEKIVKESIFAPLNERGEIPSFEEG